MKIEPGVTGHPVPFKKQYANYIGGAWIAPAKGQYFENITPVTGRPFCQVPRSTAEDIEMALDAAHKAKSAWGKASPAARASVLLKIADRMEANLDLMWGDGGIQLLILSHVFASVEVIRQLQFGCWEAGVGVLDKSARLEYNS